ncbi:beta-galactosidase [Corynebacterium mendelii]
MNEFLHDRIAYGGDWNPEQWDDQTIARDIELMTQAGVNLVTVAVFSWAKLQPDPDTFDAGWLTDILDRLHAAGIDVDLATATASPPVWLARNNPETLPVTSSGVRLGFGSRQQYCPTSAVFRSACRDLVTAMATRFGGHPAVKMWHISNEYGCHIHECFCDSCAAAFRRWLAGRYKTIGELNRVWGTAFWSQSYTSFDQITPPADMPTFHNPGQLHDWKRFNSDMLLELYNGEREILNRLTPDIPVTTNFMGLFPHCDYFRWARDIDVVSDDSYPDPANPASAAEVAFEGDVMRSLKNKPFMLMEQTPSAVQWRGVNSPKRPGQHALWSLQRIAHGADAILHFQWRQSVRGAETFHSAMVPHAGEDSRIFEQTCALGRSLAQLDSVCGSAVTSRVAMLFSWDSEWARCCAIGPTEHRFGEGARAWHRTLFEHGHTVDFVDPANLSGAANTTGQPISDLTDYALIIVPELFAADKNVAEQLEKAAAGGAQIIVAAPSGVVDSTGQASQLNLGGALAELAGVRVVEHLTASVPRWEGASSFDRLFAAPDESCDLITGAVTATGGRQSVAVTVSDRALADSLEKFGHSGRQLEHAGRIWAESLAGAGDIDVLCTYADTGSALDIAGQPAITSRQVGRGSVMYVSVDARAVVRAALVDRAASIAGISTPTMTIGIPGVEAIERGDNLFVLNHSDDTVTIGDTTMDELGADPRALTVGPRQAVVVPLK